MSDLVFGIKARLREPKSSTSYMEVDEDEFADEVIDKVRLAAEAARLDRLGYPSRRRMKHDNGDLEFDPKAESKQEKRKNREDKKKALELEIKHRLDAKKSASQGASGAASISPRRLLSLPVELLFLIFDDATLLDIVNLDKACESFNNTATAAQQVALPEALWSKVYTSAGFPALHVDDPSSKKEIVSLFLLDNCQVCGSKKWLDRDFFLRRVLCGMCSSKKSLFVLDTEEAMENLSPELHPLAKYCVYTSKKAHGGDRPGEAKYYLDDLQKASQKLYSIKDQDDAQLKGKRRSTRKSATDLGPLLAEHVDKSKKAVIAVKQSAPALARLFASRSKQQRLDDKTAKKSHKQIRIDNYKFVLDRGDELGFHPDSVAWSGARNDPLVQAPVPITWDDWYEHEDRFLAEFIKASRTIASSNETWERITREAKRFASLVSAYEALVLSQSPSESVPNYIPFCDWASLPSIRALVKDDLGESNIVKLSKLSEIRPAILSETIEWRHKATFLYSAWRLHVVHKSVMPPEWTSLWSKSMGLFGAPITPTNSFELPDNHTQIFPPDKFDGLFAHPLFTSPGANLFDDKHKIQNTLATLPTSRFLLQRSLRDERWEPAEALAKHHVESTRKVLVAAGVDESTDAETLLSELSALGNVFILYHVELEWVAPGSWTPDRTEVKLPFVGWQVATEELHRNSSWEVRLASSAKGKAV